MSSKIITTKFGRIEYSIKGHGKAILFIHGGHSNCDETLCYKGLNPEKYKFIIPSRPGYGKTSLDNNDSPKKTAALFNELLEALRIDKVIVYGISAGGLTAIEIAANYPDKVEKLILASAVSKKWLDKEGSVYKTAQKIFSPKLQKLVWGMIRFFGKIFPNMVANSFFSELSKYPKERLEKSEVRELIYALSLYHSDRGFMNDIDQNIDDSTIAKIQCSTLVIHSGYDNSVPIDHAYHAKDMIKNSQIEVLQNKWGHLFWIGDDSYDSIKKTIDFME